MRTETKERDELAMRTSADIDELLARFTDLLNAEGTKSEKLRAFRKQFGSNKELVKLMDAAVQVRTLFDKGEIE